MAHLSLMPSYAAAAMAMLTVDGSVEIGTIVEPGWSHDGRVWLNVESIEGWLRA